jgi:hypothetical protein
MSSSVHICTAGCQPSCGASDFLGTTTKCFSKVIACIVWCSCCGQNLFQFATHCWPTASIVCAKRTLAEPQNSLPKNAHEHYCDLLKHCQQHFTRQHHGISHACSHCIQVTDLQENVNPIASRTTLNSAACKSHGYRALPPQQLPPICIASTGPDTARVQMSWVAGV